MLRVDPIGFNRNFFGSQAGSPEVHGLILARSASLLKTVVFRG